MNLPGKFYAPTIMLWVADSIRQDLPATFTTSNVVDHLITSSGLEFNRAMTEKLRFRVRKVMPFMIDLQLVTRELVPHPEHPFSLTYLYTNLTRQNEPSN